MSLMQGKQAGIKDFILMDEISEDAFMDNLKTRFNGDAIYTYIGDVVVSMNPYKQLPIYDKAYMKYYKGKYSFEPDLHPHIFSLTDNAYRQMQREREDQVVIISGESGAGKTEASKQIMRYISEVSGGSATVDKTKNMLLQSNPVLEAFGNAKTNRNDNSSRFGKYMDIQFDVRGDPVGGNISDYLLEKARVVHQLKGERNFHIFYQLVKANNGKEFGLKKDPDYYPYLNQGGVSDVRSINDVKEFADVQKGMTTIGFSQGEQTEIWQVLSAILHMGILQFVSDGTSTDGSKITNREELDIAARMLGTTSGKLEHALTSSTVVAGGSIATGSLNPSKAAHARDTMCKAMYDRLFTWIVSKINGAVSVPSKEGKPGLIGVLDIYGFEIMQRNSFEQFCINYCNEKLQQLFIELTLKREQEEYAKEGIKWTPVKYFNNKVICDMIEMKYGMIDWLDEQCLRPGNKDDNMWLEKLDEKFATHEHYTSKKCSSKDKTIAFGHFRLKHYAGNVDYDTNGFIEKNTDTLFRDLSQVLFESSNQIMKSAFPEGNKATWTGVQKRPQTLGTGFKKSMNNLVANLLTKAPSYIRCIKPNDQKRPMTYDRTLVLHQVRYLGLVENLRVRRAGFCFRQSYKRFFWRYCILSSKCFPRFNGTKKEGVEELCRSLGYGPDDVQFGKTQLFVKKPKTVFELEDKREDCLHAIVVTIQTKWRAYKIKDQMAQWRTKLQKVFENVNNDPHYGKHVRWPAAHPMLRKAAEYVRKIWANWRAMKMITAFPEDVQYALRAKAIAYSHVGNGKKPWNFQRTWSYQYVDPAMYPRYQAGIQSVTAQYGNPNLWFTHDVIKISRRGSSQKRILVLTDTHLLRLNPNMSHKKQKNAKQAVPLESITGVSLSTGKDAYIAIHHAQDGCDTLVDFGAGQWEHVSEFLAMLCLVTGNRISVTVAEPFTYNNTCKAGFTGCALNFIADSTPRKPGESTGLFKVGKNGVNSVMLNCP